MARSLNVWTGKFLIKETSANTRELIFRVQIDQDPRRTLLVRLPRRELSTYDRYYYYARQDLAAHNAHNGNHRFTEDSEYDQEGSRV
jgi:hypothetical protein